MLLNKIRHLKTKIHKTYEDIKEIKSQNQIFFNEIENLKSENDNLKVILAQSLKDISVISLAVKDIYVLLGIIPEEEFEEEFDITLEEEINIVADKKKKETIH